MKKLLLPILFLAPLTGIAQPNTVANPYPRTITVTGSAEMSVVPDEIYVSITLKEYSKKGEIQKELSALTADFLASCKSLGIPDSAITVSGLSGTDNSWYWRKKPRTDPEMLAEITYEVKLARFETVEALAGKLDNVAARFRVDRLSHSNERTIRKQLKIDAVKAAKEKSVYLAEAIGEHTGQAVTITEPTEESGGAGYAVSQRMLSNNVYVGGAATGNAESGIASKKLRYRYEVSVVFALK